MIVSHTHQLIFVRTRKTAGTSLEIALSRLCGPSDIITPISPRDEALRAEAGGWGAQNYQFPHMSEPASSTPGRGPGVLFYNHMPANEARSVLGDDVWGRYYKFCVERHPYEKIISLYYHRNRAEPRVDIIDFIESGEAFDAYNWPLYTDGATPLVDRILQYSTLGDDLARLARELCLPIRFDVHAKSQFRPVDSISIPHRARGLVREYFQREFSYFNYRV